MTMNDGMTVEKHMRRGDNLTFVPASRQGSAYGDMLQAIFDRQKQLRTVYQANEVRAGIHDVDAELRLLTLAAIVELGEFLQLFNWKPWKKGRKDTSRTAQLGEYADILHFVVEMAVVCGFDAVDVFNAYMGKADVNELRQREGY